MPRPLNTLIRCSSLVLQPWLGSQLFQKHNHVLVPFGRGTREHRESAPQCFPLIIDYSLKRLFFFPMCDINCILSDSECMWVFGVVCVRAACIRDESSVCHTT